MSFANGVQAAGYGNENITYTAKSTEFGAGNLTGCSRGANSTSAASHADEAEVKSIRRSKR